MQKESPNKRMENEKNIKNVSIKISNGKVKLGEYISSARALGAYLCTHLPLRGPEPFPTRHKAGVTSG